MKKYKDFKSIKKQDIQEFRGLERDVMFAPHPETLPTPLSVTRFGITYPNKKYYIKRENSPCFIIEYIVSGSGFLEINGEKYKLSAGDAYIIHPADRCEYYADENDPYKKYWINFYSGIFFLELLKAYNINERVYRNTDLSKYFEEIFKLENYSNLNDELYIPVSKILFSIIMDLAQSKKVDTKNPKEDLAYILKQRLNRSIAVPTSLEDIAKELYRSPNDLIRHFKKRYKVTPYAYLIRMRIERAKSLLINTERNISEIASYLCFSSEYHFSNAFKKNVGMCPKEYRKKNL